MSPTLCVNGHACVRWYVVAKYVNFSLCVCAHMLFSGLKNGMVASYRLRQKGHARLRSCFSHVEHTM